MELNVVIHLVHRNVKFFVCYLILVQYKPLSETESSQESECGEGPSSQGEESDCHGDSSSQVTSQETGTEDEGTTATESK